MVPALALGGGDEHFQGRIARTRAHASERGVDAHRASLGGDDRVRDAQREIMVGVDAALGFGFEDPVIGFKPGLDPIHVERAAAVGHIDTLRAIAFHEEGLARERVGVDHVAHHEEARDVHAKVAGDADMLLGNVGLGAVGRDADRTHADVIGALQFLDRAHSGQDEGGEHRPVKHRGDRLEPFPVGMGTKAIVEASAIEAVAMGDLDCVDACVVKRLGDRLHMVDAIHVADGVHAIAQGDVLDIELVARFHVERLV
jgi:hypothetical protein